MNSTSMSLHRVIAEIKSAEEKLNQHLGVVLGHSQSIVKIFPGEAADPVSTAERTKFAQDSQSHVDKITNLISNLSVLKSARNKANAEVKISIAGKTITIDEALALKASLVYKEQLIAGITSQFNAAVQRSEKLSDEMQSKINQQIQAMFSGTRKATDEEMSVLRTATERAYKPVTVHGDGLKTKLENMMKEVSDFKTEIDYVLSEANATNKVDVHLV